MKKRISPRRHPIGSPIRSLALAIGLGIASCGFAATDPKAARFYEDALVRYEKEDLPGAIIQLKNALKIDKNMLPVHVLLGKALLDNGDFVAAEVAFQEALRLGVNRAEVVVPMAKAVVGQAKQGQLFDQPRFAEAGLPAGIRYQLLLVKAGAAGDLGDRKTALEAIEDARAIDPSSADGWLAEVPVRSRAGELREAQAAADKALSIQPGMPEALYLRGTVAHVQGDLPTALGYYDKTLQASPTHSEALVSRAGLLLDLGRHADAERDIAALEKTSPSDPRGAYMGALLAERAGRSADAKAALNKVTGLIDPIPIEYMRYRPQILMLGGLAHYGLNQREKAKPYLEAVLRGQPGSPAAKLLGQIHLSEKKVERAIEVLEAYLRANPGDAQAVMLVASAHMAQGRHGRATAMMQAAVQQADLPAFRGALGMSLMGAGKFSAAIPELEAALKRDPGQIQAGTALASLHLQLGNPGKAVAVAEALVKSKPSQPGLLYLLGTARLQAGDAKGARQALEQAAALDAAFLAPQIELARLDTATRAYDKAQARLDTVLGKDGKNIDALTAMAELHARRGQLGEARRWLEKADDHSGPGQLDAGMRLVEFDLATNRPDLAREALKRLTGKAPEALRVQVMQARVQLANADAPGARTTLTRASGLAAYDAPALVQIASLQLTAQHPAGAAHSLEKALSAQPGHFRALALMTQVEIQQGDLVKAEQRARQIVASHPKQGVGHSLLGDIALARGQRPAALESYKRAHQLDQSSASLLRLFQVLGASDPAGAWQLGEQWIKSHPQDLAVRRAVADGHARSGNLSAARAAYEAVLKLAPDDAEAMNNLANVLILAKDPQALVVAERALALKPGAAHIIGTAGWAAFKAGQTDRALQLLRDARLRDPSNAETRYFLGSVLASAGRNAEARQELEAALSTSRAFASAKDAERLLDTLK
ncbi:MAG: PEP-CTERM system TPR-repeat protein PrsT [Burkholderiaceae bacterium]|nr:PEP-CTERM system TPR-repeat protein PrsT [Burkholderiaceae bacterium]